MNRAGQAENDTAESAEFLQEEPPDSVFISSFKAIKWAVVWWLTLFAEMGKALNRKRLHQARPWQIKIKPRHGLAKQKPPQLDSLMNLHRSLDDFEKISSHARDFHSRESDFFADKKNVEEFIRCLIEKNPPWLYISRPLSGGEHGEEEQADEVLWREREVVSNEEVELFIPDESWRDLPLSSMTLRPTHTFDEVWRARLLDQILPAEVLVDRHNRGEILIPIHNFAHQRLEFRLERRNMELTIRKPVPISIPSEGGSGTGGQLLYILLDSSASMQGKSAVLAMAVIAAVIRANMGQKDTFYLFRSYAEELWPKQVAPPFVARSLQEKDALLDIILSINFNGVATHVNAALDVAVEDILHLKRDEHRDAGLLLVTDGRAEILESTRLRLRRAEVKLHTVMVTREYNPGLEAISESYTSLDISSLV